MEEETTQDEFTVKFAAVCDECRGPLMESSTESRSKRMSSSSSRPMKAERRRSGSFRFLRFPE